MADDHGDHIWPCPRFYVAATTSTLCTCPALKRRIAELPADDAPADPVASGDGPGLSAPTSGARPATNPRHYSEAFVHDDTGRIGWHCLGCGAQESGLPDLYRAFAGAAHHDAKYAPTDGAAAAQHHPSASDDGSGGSLCTPRAGHDPGPSSPSSGGGPGVDAGGSPSAGARPVTPAAEYRLTFGAKYDRELHPRGPWVDPDGWVTIVAASRTEARWMAIYLFGWYWSDLYDPEEFPAEVFSAGELLRIVVPAGLTEVEDHRV